MLPAISGVWHSLLMMLLCCAGNTEQRPAQNEAAWDDHSAPRLYDMTKKIVDEKTANF